MILQSRTLQSVHFLSLRKYSLVHLTKIFLKMISWLLQLLDISCTIRGNTKLKYGMTQIHSIRLRSYSCLINSSNSRIMTLSDLDSSTFTLSSPSKKCYKNAQAKNPILFLQRKRSVLYAFKRKNPFAFSPRAIIQEFAWSVSYGSMIHLIKSVPSATLLLKISLKKNDHFYN